MNAAVRRGFTLLELLVAMAAAALLLALLSQATGGLQLAARRAMGDARPVIAELEAQQTVVRLLSEILPAGAEDKAQGFAGRSRSVDFVAAPPDALRHLGPVHVRLLEAPVSAGLVGLFIEMRSARATAAGLDTPRRELLIGPLRALQFRYGATPQSTPQSGAALQEQWFDEGRPPGFVQLTWQHADQADKSTTVAAAIRRTLPGSCRFDPISLTCGVRDGR